MRLDPPCNISEESLTIDVREIEPLLQAPPMDLEPWPGATVALLDGRVLFIREARREEAPQMIEYMKRVTDTEHDFYDVVGSRCLAEIIGWYRHRIKDPYVLIGLIDGVWAGFANGRLFDEDINISLHTMAMIRGGRIGAVMYYAKAYYGFEILGSKEWWATYESYNGWMRWGLGMAQPSYPWPKVQHELGGARVYYINRQYWDKVVKAYLTEMIGTELNFDVPDKIRERNQTLIVPDQVLV